MAFLLAIFPLMSTIPNPHHSFLVHLMNCYFPDFWYSHVTEKRISEGRKQYAKKTGYYVGAKYTLGVGREMGDKVFE